MKKEVIELEATWYGGGYHFRLLDDKNGFTGIGIGFADSKTCKIEDSKIGHFWKKVEDLGVWKRKKKYNLSKYN